MSSSDTRIRRPGPAPTRRAALGFGLAAALALAGCQVRPLYGTVGSAAGDPALADELARIDIAPVDTVSDRDLERVGQVLRNELIFGFQRGRAAPDPAYRLKIIIDRPLGEVGVERLADVPAAYTVTVNASYVLSDIASGQTLETGSAFATASFDFSSQRFANLRAERDAEDRAAKAVAVDIQTRIAGFFAARS